MGRHRNSEAKPATSERALLVAVAALVGAVVIASIAVVALLGGGDDEVTADPSGNRRTATPPATSTTPSTMPGAGSAESAPTPQLPGTPAPAAPGAPAVPDTPAPQSAPATLAFRVVGGQSWIRVSAGEEILVSGTFQEGDRRSFDQPELTVRVGDAGNVRFVVNGKPRPLGAAGQIDEFTVRRG